MSTENRKPKTGNRRRSGFTLVEVMVAIAVATILFGICIAIYVKANAYKRRSEQVLFIAEEARGALTMIARDVEGLYVSSAVPGECFSGSGQATAANKITLITATENAGKADYCKVEYYVDNGNLHRDWAEPMADGSWPVTLNSVIVAEKIDSLYVETVPGNNLPKTATFTLQIPDPDGQPPYRRFTMTVRPGAEE